MFETTNIAHNTFEDDVIEGLSQVQKAIPCRWLYDERGSELFEDITVLPEYYPTRTETSILSQYAPEIASHVGPHATVVEYGAGASVKTRILMDALEELSTYIPVDISAEFLQSSAASLKKDYPGVKIEPVVADFLSTVDLPEKPSKGARVGFFPGSTIGNLESTEITGFMTRARTDLGPEAHFILGADLKKDPTILIPAYDDAAGITSEFNLNLLRRINGELEANFDVSAFNHEARWNEAASRIEMHLVSERDQSVEVSGQTFNFKHGETVHTENSRKFEIGALQELIAQCGWKMADSWIDKDSLFSVLLFKAI
ncbi:MAG: L-histidine N(alpha)-methyltransferase [Halioglobus sp.]